jgi:hypothetical protein
VKARKVAAGVEEKVVDATGRSAQSTDNTENGTKLQENFLNLNIKYNKKAVLIAKLV